MLLYNTVGYHPGPASTLPAATLAADLAVGVVGALAAAQAVLPAMRARGRGTLLFTGGGAAFGPSTQVATLAVQKAALRNLVLSLAEELEPEGLRVGTVTVAGWIQPGTAFDPDRIADVYWAMHDRTRAEREIVFRGE